MKVPEHFSNFIMIKQKMLSEDDRKIIIHYRLAGGVATSTNYTLIYMGKNMRAVSVLSILIIITITILHLSVVSGSSITRYSHIPSSKNDIEANSHNETPTESVSVIVYQFFSFFRIDHRLIQNSKSQMVTNFVGIRI